MPRFTRKKRGGALSPLMEAIDNHDYDRVLELIEQGEDVNATDGWNGQTPLLLAIDKMQFRESTDIVKALIEAGADYTIPDRSGETSLILTIKNYRFDEDLYGEILDILMENPTHEFINAQTTKGNNALFEAITRNIPGFVKRLLEAGADVHAENNQHESALIKAIQSKKNAESWMERGSPDAVESRENAIQILDMLLEHGAIVTKYMKSKPWYRDSYVNQYISGKKQNIAVALWPKRENGKELPEHVIRNIAKYAYGGRRKTRKTRKQCRKPRV